MKYVALLRGINIGGRNKIEMKLLKQTFERVGMRDVITYINSGNIIFSTENLLNIEIEELLAKAILQDFKLDIKVLVWSFPEIESIYQAIPDAWRTDKEMRSDILFLWDEINHQTILNELVIKQEVDTVTYVPGAILWSFNRTKGKTSGMTSITKAKFYQKITIRNVNTVRKIYDLMQG